jgi:hypothetical protein
MWADLFGVASAETFNQSNQAHAVNYLTLVQLLIQKRIVSADEIADARIKATHFVEQEWARKREEQEREFDEKHPGLRKLLGQVSGSDPDA